MSGEGACKLLRWGSSQWLACGLRLRRALRRSQGGESFCRSRPFAGMSGLDPLGAVGSPLPLFRGFLGPESKHSTVIIFPNLPFFQGFWRFRKTDSWKEWGRSPKRNSSGVPFFVRFPLVHMEPDILGFCRTILLLQGPCCGFHVSGQGKQPPRLKTVTLGCDKSLGH